MPPLSLRLGSCFRHLFVAVTACAALHATTTDTLVFGDVASERAHALVATRSDTITGALGEPARRLLAPATADWRGGTVAFTLKVDPTQPNYLTIRLSGDEVAANRLVLTIGGKQIGYLHLGDYELLDYGSEELSYNGRFYYRTTPLPLALTQGKTELACEIRSHGPTWGYGASFEQYQKPMTEPSRGLYRVYSHTEGCFVPSADEQQGEAPRDPPLRRSPGPEVIDAVKARVSRALNGILTRAAPPNQMEMQFLAHAWRVTWTAAYHNPQTIARIIAGADKLAADFKANPRIAEAGPASWNPDWFGLGPVGECVSLLAAELAPRLDEKLSTGLTRRAAWTQMLVYSRDWHRRHRRLYTNQTMINDTYGIYLSNRGVAALDPAQAAPEKAMLRYLYESVGLEPWRDSDPGGTGTTETGGKNWGVGPDYWQITAKGLTRELGYVGTYGEVLDWLATLYNATRPTPDQPGDAKIKAQIIKLARARAPFRFPALDAEGHRAMRLETVIGWRDAHSPGDVTYGQRTAWDGSSLQLTIATLDPELVGYAQQMLADNQYFEIVRTRMKNDTLRVTSGLLETPDEYAALLAQPPQSHRLPMSPGRGDFVFTDEQDGVVALKHGEEILYVSLYWRARHAINFLARVHLLTPRYDRIATVREEIEFESSGLTYTRPDHIDFGFANGGHKYPGDLHSAHAGEKLPIPKIPDGVRFTPGDESVYAGKGDFYTLRYGTYLIAMNTTVGKTFHLTVPAANTTITDLVTGRTVAPASELTIAPRSTVVLYFQP